MGCKYALNFRSILWPIVNVTPGNAGFMDKRKRAFYAAISVHAVLGAINAAIWCEKTPLDVTVAVIAGAIIGVLTMYFETLLFTEMLGE